MARKPDEWMPLHIGAYLADTTNLTRDQHGAYLLLIMTYWRRGEALPADDGQLAAMAKATPNEWRKMKPIIAPFFRPSDGKWFHKRCEEELSAARARMAAKSAAGKKGANSRWQTEGRGNGYDIADASGSQWQTNASTTENPSPEPKIENTTTTESGCFVAFFDAMPRRIGRKEAQREYESAISKASPESILTAAKAYAIATRGYADQYVLSPTKWLQDERWTDNRPQTTAKTSFNSPEEQALQEQARRIANGEAAN